MRIGAILAAALALALFEGEAAASVPRSGQLILSSCRQGECAWIQVLRVEPAGRVPQGRLVRLVGRRGRSVHLDRSLPRNVREADIDWERTIRTEYAFCSRIRPAFAFESERGPTIVHFLDLFELAGYQLSSARAYMRLCHGVNRLPSARILRRLGYRRGTRSEQLEAADVTILTRF